MVRRAIAMGGLALAMAVAAGCGGGAAGEPGPATTATATVPSTAPGAQARAADRLADDRAARRLLDGREGAVVALDLRTGRVLASAGDTTGTLVEPGSTMKALIAGLALEAGVVTPAGPLDGDAAPVAGAENFGGERFGPLTVAEALALSSNTAIAGLALELGPAALERGLRRGGWGRASTGVADVPALVDAGGTYLDPIDHQPTTVRQLARLAAAIAGDGTAPGAGRLWSASVSAQLRRGLRLAVTDGTGTSMLDRGLPIAAKTGTMWRDDGRVQASVIAMAPLPRPTVVVAVSLAAGTGRTGGEAAGPVARALLRRLVS